jgi:hypothetical protein
MMMLKDKIIMLIIAITVLSLIAWLIYDEIKFRKLKKNHFDNLVTEKLLQLVEENKGV